MLSIDSNTRISVILKAHPDALEALVSVSPSFEKLRNPILRKLLSPRVSISEAAAIGKCSREAIFGKLRALGFKVEGDDKPDEKIFGSLRPSAVKLSMDVSVDIENGDDPLAKISAAINRLGSGESLELLTSFVPYPLIRLMKKRDCTVNVIEEGSLVKTYFTAGGTTQGIALPDAEFNDELFAKIRNKYEGRLKEINVRDLPMPQPMLRILAELEELPEDNALLVRHKKVPVMLLPELKERAYKYGFAGDEPGILMIIWKA